MRRSFQDAFLLGDSYARGSSLRDNNIVGPWNGFWFPQAQPPLMAGGPMTAIHYPEQAWVDDDMPMNDVMGMPDGLLNASETHSHLRKCVCVCVCHYGYISVYIDVANITAV